MEWKKKGEKRKEGKERKVGKGKKKNGKKERVSTAQINSYFVQGQTLGVKII